MAGSHACFHFVAHKCWIGFGKSEVMTSADLRTNQIKALLWHCSCLAEVTKTLNKMSQYLYCMDYIWIKIKYPKLGSNPTFSSRTKLDIYSCLQIKKLWLPTIPLYTHIRLHCGKASVSKFTS